MQTFEPDPQDRLDDKLNEERFPELRFLHPRQIAMIDEALQCLGAFGEVRLVVEQGRLRFILTQKSYDALRWFPGRIKPVE